MYILKLVLIVMMCFAIFSNCTKTESESNDLDIDTTEIIETEMMGNDTKMDAPLRKLIRQSIHSDDTIKINCLAELTGPLDENMRAQIEATGVKVNTTVNHIITLSGKAKEISELSTLDFVVQLQLSQQRSFN